MAPPAILALLNVIQSALAVLFLNAAALQQRATEIQTRAERPRGALLGHLSPDVKNVARRAANYQRDVNAQHCANVFAESSTLMLAICAYLTNQRQSLILAVNNIVASAPPAGRSALYAPLIALIRENIMIYNMIQAALGGVPAAVYEPPIDEEEIHRDSDDEGEGGGPSGSVGANLTPALEKLAITGGTAAR